MKYLFPIIVVLLLYSTPTWAASAPALSLAELAEHSDLVVIAETTSLEYRVEKGRVFTHVEFTVEKQLKGSSIERFTVVQIGGRTAELVTRVPGMPEFQEGERSLLFLQAVEDWDHYVVTGLSQGKFRIVTGPDETTPYLVPETSVSGGLDVVPPRLESSTDLRLPESGDIRAAGLHFQVHSYQGVMDTLEKLLLSTNP